MIDMETRVRRLERTNRWLAVGLVLAAGAAVAMGAARNGDEKIIRADKVITRSISVVRPNGEIAILLDANKGFPLMSVYDIKEAARIILGIDEGGTASATVNNGEDTSQVRIESGGKNDEGKSSISSILMTDQANEERLQFAADSQSDILIRGRSRKGESKVFASFGPPQAKAKP